MRFFRNWLLPILFGGFGALLGIIVIGLPGYNMVQTIDGVPVVGGYLRSEEISTIIDQGKRLGSHIDFYGVLLPGEPIYWVIAIVCALAFIGYRVGLCFREK